MSTDETGGDQEPSWTQALGETQKQVDESIRVGAREFGKGVLSLRDALSTSYSATLAAFDEAKGYVDQAQKQAQEAEDAAVSGAKSAMAWGAANPNLAYPAAGASVLLLLPGARRLLWRKTFGRLRNPEVALKNSADRVQSVHTHVNDHATQLSKLQERMLAAEAEYNSGYSKLKATRIELQRLASNVAKDEKTANAVVQELRALKAMNASLNLRAEAASHLAQLRTQKQQANKHIYRIANRDI
ncbi:hypothetical protein DUNSADRAFT_8590 [Dunaliella salina]|uniref:Uncharacterized protein n=1 Tax=Dunaliella salina TaxID=3046 RepID=A0ABQ7H5Q6_DUNSA|nr:hypothetical protein DUNSADRAFT_8590 [Dunaliella salina]|eukprot:KAF5842190.1 hypothetical protein DUNSADRAFT_8590 [Dunaliella salina]